MQTGLFYSPDQFAGIISEVSESIAINKSNATLLGWDDDDNWNPTRTIEVAKVAFSDNGWTWNDASRQLEKDGWRIWFRSQGVLSSPIIQWSWIP